MFKMWMGIARLGALAAFLLETSAMCTEKAKDDIMAMYQRAASLTVELSLNVSTTMSKAVDRFYSEADRVETEADHLKVELIRLTHSIISRGNQASQCVNSHSPSTAISKMYTALASSTKCLHDKAFKCSQLEIEVTVALNHYRNHVMEGMDVLDKCKPTVVKPVDEFCVRVINQELETQTEYFLKTLLTIRNKVEAAEKEVSYNIYNCGKKFNEAMNKVNKTLNDTLVCSKL